MLGGDKEERGGGRVEMEQRKEFYSERGISVKWIRRSRKEERVAREEIEDRDRDIQERERYNKVQKSRWNRWYKEMRVSRYLREKGKEERVINMHTSSATKF